MLKTWTIAKLILLCLVSPYLQASEAMDFSALKETLRVRACQGIILNGELVRAPLIVIGLGNIGDVYEGTRHNVGRNMLQLLAKAQSAKTVSEVEATRSMTFATEAEAEEYFDYTGASRPERSGTEVRFQVGGEIMLLPEGHPWLAHGEILFAFPGFDINESGHFVGELARSLQIPMGNIVVFFDDILMQRRQIILSQGKAEAATEAPAFKDAYGDGHNGIRSLNEHLGGASYQRIRFGVSSPRQEKIDMTLSDWVLSPLPEEDRFFYESKASDLGNLLALIHEGRQLSGAQSQRILGSTSRLAKALKK